MKMFQYYDYSDRIKTYSQEDKEALKRLLENYQDNPNDLLLIELRLWDGDKPTNLEGIMELF